MLKINFKNPKTRILADKAILIVLTFFALGFIMYNLLLPNNTVIECNKKANICKITYTSILRPKSIHKNIVFKLSNVKSIDFYAGSRGRTYPNMEIFDGHTLYFNIIEPRINIGATKALVNNMNNYLKNSDNNFYFNRNDIIISETRNYYILGIFIYYFICLIMIISDIRYYKE